MSKYRIMTFDGGGVRGALTAVILERLAQGYPALFDKVELFAGTSTGSLIALGLAHGIKPNELVQLYSQKNGEFIFSPAHNPLVRPKYDHTHLKELLQSVFPPDLQLKDLKRKVLLPSFKITCPDCKAWRPVFFNNLASSATQDEFVVDVALASCAAPVYFPSYQNHIDGGVIANNPSTAAIALAKDRKAGNQDINSIYLLSFGTGFISHKISVDTEHWGAFQWLFSSPSPFPLLSVLSEGVVEADAHFSSQLLGPGQYCRLNPVLSEPIGLDEYKKIPELVKLGREYDLNAAINWINANWF